MAKQDDVLEIILKEIINPKLQMKVLQIIDVQTNIVLITMTNPFGVDIKQIFQLNGWNIKSREVIITESSEDMINALRGN